MKTKLNLVLAALVAGISIFFLSGCAGTTSSGGSVAANVESSLKYLKPSATAIGSGVLIATKDPVVRVKRAESLHAIAVGVRTLAGDQPVSAEDFAKLVKTLVPSSDPELATLALSVSTLFNSVRPQVSTDVAAYLKAVTAIADGLDLAASPYLVKTATISMVPSEFEMDWLFYDDFVEGEYTGGVFYVGILKLNRPNLA